MKKEEKKKLYNKKLIEYFDKKKSLKIMEKKKIVSGTVFSFIKLDLIEKIGKKIKMNLIGNNVSFEEFILFFGKEKLLSFEKIFKVFLKFPFFLSNEDALGIANYIFEDNLIVKRNGKNEKSFLEFNIFKCIIRNLIKEYKIFKNDVFMEKINQVKKVK